MKAPTARPRTAVIALAAALTLAACTAETDTPVPTGAVTASQTAPADPEPVTRTVSVGGADVELAVGPVVVSGDLGVLRLAATTRTSSVNLMTTLQDPYSAPAVAASGVRLVDLERGTVSLPARDASDRPVLSSGVPLTVEPGAEPIVMHVAYAAPEGTTTSVLVPGAGLFTDVPVVAADDAGDMTVPLGELTDEPTGAFALPVAALEAYSEELGGLVRARVAPEQVAVEVAADVLFAPDSDVLGPDSDAALTAAGAHVAAYDSGALRVVGHTDDVADEAHNQALSERRARAVADRLGVLLDTSPYAVTVEGRGEAEPAAAGIDPDARALNRRVELLFTPDAPAGALAVDVEGALPEATGPSGPGADGVTVEQTSALGSTGSFRVALEEVRRIDGYLVGELTLTNTGTAEASLVTVLAASAWDARGQFDPHLQTAASKVALVRGGTLVYPVDYQLDGGREPLADRMMRSLPAGERRTVTVVWPDVGGDAVVVDAPQRSLDITAAVSIDVGGPPFRLTEVPVVDG
jgi:outer membrane protein OmpA-like peptidoglycan-associated protein